MAGQQQGGGGGRRATREARLADKLRQNLVRRKAKTRALRDGAASSATSGGAETRTRRSRQDDSDERDR
jgi:hypothetical protein